MLYLVDHLSTTPMLPPVLLKQSIDYCEYCKYIK